MFAGYELLPPVVRRVVGQRAAPAVDGRAEQRARGIPGPGHLAALLQAGSGSLSGTVTGYPEQVRIGSASTAAGPFRR
ncbi:MAG TPA: hypothetical protein VHS30_30870 [Streptosporangiaceae bacterium]|nr:hypothetical protein [Streptosporangiaceae bacterium]